MSAGFWFLPAIAAWLAVVAALLIRLNRMWAYGAFDRAIGTFTGYVLGVLDSIRDPWRVDGEGTLREVRMASLRYLAALGGFFLTLFLIGVGLGFLGVGIVATLLLMFFPGSLAAAAVYRRLIHR